MEQLHPLIKKCINVSAMFPKASVLSGFDKALLTIQCFLVMWWWKAGRLNCFFFFQRHISAPGSLIKMLLSLVFFLTFNIAEVKKVDKRILSYRKELLTEISNEMICNLKQTMSL